MTRFFSFARQIALGIALLLCVFSHAFGQSTVRLDSKSQRIVKAVTDSVRSAGMEFHAGRFDKSGAAVEKAMKQIQIAIAAGTPELYDALLPSMERIKNAHVMLELEGISLPPFRKPARPSTGESAEVAAVPMPKGTAPSSIFQVEPAEMAGTPVGQTEGVSFVSEVAPILSSKCGSCHIRGSKGGFSTESFAVLMKGPPEGVVVFPGDPIGSRLIETIETGDMPRGGGKVSPMELATLQKWITEGAKFDGADPSVALTSLTPGTAATPAEPMVTEVAAPTGNETVSFASDVAPLLVKNCTGCHIDAMQARGGLRMDTLARMFRGGDSGQVVAPGKGDASLLVRKLRGLEGDRMPAGGRPAFSDASIQLIATWIDEGARVDNSMQEIPLGVITQKAWLAAATPDQVTERRAELAEQHFRLAGADVGRLSNFESDKFALWGEVPESTLELIAAKAELALSKAKLALPATKIEVAGADAQSLFGGKASIYVLPRRYDYSEFAKMVEGRGLPSDWKSHWRYDGIQAYIALVASSEDSDEDISERLAAPVVSLGVASRELSVPRWFANGLGQVTSTSGSKTDRRELAAKQAELVTAIGSLKSGKDFFAGKLPPERADRLAAAVCESFFSRDRKRGFDTIMRQLEDGKSFDVAFLTGMGMNPTAYFDAWLQWAK